MKNLWYYILLNSIILVFDTLGIAQNSSSFERYPPKDEGALSFHSFYSYRRKSESYSSVNSTIKIVLKEEYHGVTFDRKSFTYFDNGDELLKITFSENPAPTSTIYMVKNQITNTQGVLLWNHFRPELYRVKAELISTIDNLNILVEDTIGIRDVRVHEGTLLINNIPVPFKCFEEGSIQADSLFKFLPILKRYHINTILLSDFTSDLIMKRCDSLGIYVLLTLSERHFKDTVDLKQKQKAFLNYPSMIAYILPKSKEMPMDFPYQPILREMPSNTIYPVIKKDDFLTETEKNIIKRKLQPFQIIDHWRNDENGVVYVTLSNKEKLNISDFKVIYEIFDPQGRSIAKGDLEEIEKDNDNLLIKLKDFDFPLNYCRIRIQFLSLGSFPVFVHNEQFSILELIISE